MIKMLPLGYVVIYEGSENVEKPGDNITQGKERCSRVRDSG